MSLSLFAIPSASSTNFVIVMFSPVSFKEPKETVPDATTRPSVDTLTPVPLPAPSVSSTSPTIALLSLVLINPS